MCRQQPANPHKQAEAQQPNLEAVAAVPLSFPAAVHAVV